MCACIPIVMTEGEDTNLREECGGHRKSWRDRGKIMKISCSVCEIISDQRSYCV